MISPAAQWQARTNRSGFSGRCCSGFRDGLAQELVPADAARAPAYVAFMLGVRFLTDHLLGDRYFRVRRHGDNLERARAQFSLGANAGAYRIRTA